MRTEILMALKEATDGSRMNIDHMATTIALFLMRAAKVEGLVGASVLNALADELSDKY